MAKPGERKLQILQTLAATLENPKGEKTTTAALAARLDCCYAIGRWQQYAKSGPGHSPT